MGWFETAAKHAGSADRAPRILSRRGLLGSMMAMGGGALAATLPGTSASGASCPAGHVLCGPICVKLARDPENCGACGNACAAGSTCSAGLCCPCQTTNCSGTCVDLWTSAADCGTCGHACPSGHICRDGRCITPSELSCTSASDWGTSDDCVTYVCRTGLCHATCAAAGTPTSNQVSGDCLLNVCDGRGDIVSQVDDADTPPSTGCATGICTDGTPSYVDDTLGTVCSGGVCDGNGNCVQCLTADECRSTDCMDAICSEETCGTTNVANGTQCPSGTCQNGICTP